TWRDLDFKAGTLSVNKSLSITKAGPVVKETKSAPGRRSLALPQYAIDALSEYKSHQLKAGLIGAPRFCTRTGGYLAKRNVLRSLKRVINQANARPAPAEDKPDRVTLPAALRFHDLRHTVASLLLSKGHSLRAVSQRLGHSNPAFTLRVYAHAMPTDDRQLAEGLNKVLVG